MAPLLQACRSKRIFAACALLHVGFIVLISVSVRPALARSGCARSGVLAGYCTSKAFSFLMIAQGVCRERTIELKWSVAPLAYTVFLSSALLRAQLLSLGAFCGLLLLELLVLLWTARAIAQTRKRVPWRNYKKVCSGERMLLRYHLRTACGISVQLLLCSWINYASGALLVFRGSRLADAALHLGLFFFFAVFPDRNSESTPRRATSLLGLSIALACAGVQAVRVSFQSCLLLALALPLAIHSGLALALLAADCYNFGSGLKGVPDSLGEKIQGARRSIE